MNDNRRIDRREFVRRSLAGGAVVLSPLGYRSWPGERAVALITDPADVAAAARPAQWALGELQRALSDAGYSVRRLASVEDAAPEDLCIVAASAGTTAAAGAPDEPEGLAIVPTVWSGQDTLLTCGADVRGLVYALLELADRVRHRSNPGGWLGVERPAAERPANSVRSVMRQFTSEMLDKPWFYDRDMWPAYLSTLATHRFNRLHLAFGFGYDSLQRVADSYFLFVYPFLLSVAGYDVRAANLPDAERDRNLETLRFISEATVARGMEFQLGIWTHGYRWGAGSTARYTIEGLTADTHAPYCRDALTAVLRTCPAISSVALRIHGESGIAEGSYGFWRTVFDGVARCGRTVEIDLHAKGIDARMIEEALATGMPVNLSPKFAAEHLGLPYHQAAIRELEMPVPGRTGRGLMTLSEGARVFTRYGYADLLRHDRAYTVRPRVFSGTQRLLLSGDPAGAAAYARAFQFCGMTGFDLMEPLTCRGRRGTGDGTRLGYRDPRLAPRWDWEKYTYWYRTWGRLTFDPDADPEVWRREFAGDSDATALESCLTAVSRVLPLITSAYLPSAACDAYWPEIYWNQPIVGEPRPNPYGDTPAPKTFQHASPLDPQVFVGMSEFADELLRGERSGKCSPIEVAQRLEDLADDALAAWARVSRTDSPARIRLATDVAILAGLSRFFAAKFRSGVLYAIHEQAGDRRALEAALAAYRRARTAWVDLAQPASAVYQPDLSVSDRFSERGQWSDRLSDIDADIERMAARLATPDAREAGDVADAIAAATGHPPSDRPSCGHSPPSGYRPGEALPIVVTVESPRTLTAAYLCYRHVNQAERYERSAMSGGSGHYQGSIPADYTDSPYPLQYYFELHHGPTRAWLYPGIGADFLRQPYFVLRRT